MTYMVKAIFKTIQGEGYHAGRVAVFCRFAGCNLWTGREKDRSSAVCQFCDTDFVGGTRYDVDGLIGMIASTWGPSLAHRFVVFTGGEPLLQLDRTIIAAVSQLGFSVAVETNGTIPAPIGIQWLCVSPKAGAEIKQREADELKIVWPQGLDPQEIREIVTATRLSIQPMAGRNAKRNMSAAVDYCLAHPEWRLSIQTHKIAGIP